jgi:hypothetical protein
MKYTQPRAPTLHGQMPDSYDLTKLDENSFEHLANFLALRVLGAGHTGFGPGSDGGRDGLFEGEAPYPSDVNRWSGRWYIQCKYHRPHLSKDPQKWLLSKIEEEIELFQDHRGKRTWPDNWIFVTNIEPSGTPETGSFDRALDLVTKANKELGKRFHIWGGAKVIQLLVLHSEIADYYSHFLTPGHVLSTLYRQLSDVQADTRSIVRHFVVTQFNEQQFTKLEQAGSNIDTRPGIHRLFTDLPFRCRDSKIQGMSLQYLVRAAAQNHRAESRVSDLPRWLAWRKNPRRARVWFIKGGPGQGKSTLTQYLAQIQRAALLLGAEAPPATIQQLETAKEIQEAATNDGLWPLAPRIPVYVELKDFAKWFGERQPDGPRGILTFLADRLSARIQQPVHVGTLKRAFSEARWLFVFDGLDEVPSDVKDNVAGEITLFIDDQLIEIASDAFFVCTSRPQGYSGQFSNLESTETELAPLNTKQALTCAAPVLRIDRDELESAQNLETLREALQSPSIAEIMTTPLQAHIMAVVVRDGGRPPDRKWRLFTNFYQVIKKREANRNLPDKRISTLLRTGDKLIKALHNRLGYELHARAETSKGAQTSIDRAELLEIIQTTVSELQSTNVADTVNTLKEATTERLVLVNTPESGAHVRFDIRPLQEFFAAEFVYEDTSAERLGERIGGIADDAHWREVMHFVLSALIENSRRTDLAVAVEKLSYLNEKDDTSPSRFFYRRLAAGALLAARLLAEGVLEQDKRVRQQFKKTIEPLFGSTETSLNDVLASVTGTDSTSWLIEVMADTLLEQSESESIGAAYVLCLIVLDSHGRQSEIEKGILGKSPEYRGCLFRMLAKKHNQFSSEDAKWKPHIWVGKLIFISLCSADWERLNPDGVETAFEVLSSFGNSILTVAHAAGIDSALAHFIQPLIDDDIQFDAATETDFCGVVKFGYAAPKPELDPNNWSDELRAAVLTAPGVFSVIQPIFAISSGNRNIEFITRLAHISRFLRALPFVWSAYIPRELLNAKLCDQICSQRLLSPPILTWESKPGCYTTSISLEENVDRDSYEKLLRTHPRIALNIVSLAFHRGNETRSSWSAIRTYFETTDGGAELAAVVCGDPDWLRREVNSWGLILELCGPSAYGKIRAAIVDAAPMWNGERSYSEIKPFVLDLPKESCLIAPILYALCRPSPHLSETSVNVSNVVMQFAPNIELVLAIALDDRESRESRGVASVMALMHPSCPPDSIGALIDIVIAGYKPLANSWYIRLAAASLEKLIIEGRIDAISAMGSLLRIGNNDLGGRFSLGAVFGGWRERSRAPVTSLGLANF